MSYMNHLEQGLIKIQEEQDTFINIVTDETDMDFIDD